MSDLLKNDGVHVIALILIGSFVIDRAATGLLALLSMNRLWERLVPEPSVQADPVARFRAERARNVAYFTLTGALSLLALWKLGNVRVLMRNPILDWSLTGFLLMTGSDRVAGLLKTMSGASGPAAGPPENKPLEVTGTVTIEDVATKNAQPGLNRSAAA